MTYIPGGGSGGGGTVASSGDVALNNPGNGDVLAYVPSIAKWQNVAVNDVPSVITIVPNTATTYTVSSGDVGKMIECSSASSVTVTIPATEFMPIGASLAIRQYGTGAVTISGANGVTIRSRGNAYTLAGQYAEATITRRELSEYILIGDLTV